MRWSCQIFARYLSDICQTFVSIYVNLSLPISGIRDKQLGLMAKCGKSRADSHVCSNLHRLLKRTGKMLDVKISTTPLWVRYTKKRPQQALVNYPILRITDWANTIFRRGGHFFLGGHSLDNPEPFQRELQKFWERFQVTDPDFPMPQKSEWSKCIPIAVHGDEGRGRLKSPIMIITVQPILPLIGCKTNMQGNLIFEYVVFFGFDFELELTYDYERAGCCSFPVFHGQGHRCAPGYSMQFCRLHTASRASTNF